MPRASLQSEKQVLLGKLRVEKELLKDAQLVGGELEFEPRQ